LATQLSRWLGESQMRNAHEQFDDKWLRTAGRLVLIFLTLTVIVISLEHNDLFFAQLKV
jgi:hypothetical protein